MRVVKKEEGRDRRWEERRKRKKDKRERRI
jgi:hypothetical protein